MSSEDFYTVPKSQGTRRENRFRFRAAEGGKVFSLPKLQFLSGETSEYITEKMNSLSEAALTRGMIGIECPSAVDAIKKLADDQIIEISQAWVEASTINLGESQGSEDS